MTDATKMAVTLARKGASDEVIADRITAAGRRHAAMDAAQSEPMSTGEEQQVWRVVLATGEVLSVDVQEFTRGRWIAVGRARGYGDTPRDAVWRALDSDTAEILAPGEPTREELIAKCDAARADHAAAESCLAGIVRVWQRADDDDWRMADIYVNGLRREIEEARDGRDGEWWEKAR